MYSLDSWIDEFCCGIFIAERMWRRRTRPAAQRPRLLHSEADLPASRWVKIIACVRLTVISWDHQQAHKLKTLLTCYCNVSRVDAYSIVDLQHKIKESFLGYKYLRGIPEWPPDESLQAHQSIYLVTTCNFGPAGRRFRECAVLDCFVGLHGGWVLPSWFHAPAKSDWFWTGRPPNKVCVWSYLGCFIGCRPSKTAAYRSMQWLWKYSQWHCQHQQAIRWAPRALVTWWYKSSIWSRQCWWARSRTDGPDHLPTKLLPDCEWCLSS